MLIYLIRATEIELDQLTQQAENLVQIPGGVVRADLRTLSDIIHVLHGFYLNVFLTAPSAINA